MLCVVGLGYIGLPTALMLAANGSEVVGVDCLPEVVASLRQKRLTFREDGMAELFDRALERGIAFTTEYPEADVYIISVPTPYDQKSKKVNMDYVAAAVKQVLAVCPQDSVIVIESTVSPGSIDRHIRPLVAGNAKGVRLAHAPERIIPGSML